MEIKERTVKIVDDVELQAELAKRGLDTNQYSIWDYLQAYTEDFPVYCLMPLEQTQPYAEGENSSLWFDFVLHELKEMFGEDEVLVEIWNC